MNINNPFLGKIWMATNGICRERWWQQMAADIGQQMLSFVLWKMDEWYCSPKSHRRMRREMKLVGIQNLFGSMQSMPIYAMKVWWIFARNLDLAPQPVCRVLPAPKCWCVCWSPFSTFRYRHRYTYYILHIKYYILHIRISYI